MKTTNNEHEHLSFLVALKCLASILQLTNWTNITTRSNALTYFEIHKALSHCMKTKNQLLELKLISQVHILRCIAGHVLTLVYFHFERGLAALMLDAPLSVTPALMRRVLSLH